MPPRYPAVATTSSLAYITLRRTSEPARRWELGATGHGPQAAELAGRLCAQIRAWSTRRTAQPRITAHPSDASSQHDHGEHTIQKPRTKLEIRFEPSPMPQRATS